MPSCSEPCVELRRARPLLGTFVEVRATAPTAALADRAVDAAFAAIGRVHRLMSFHDPASDVGRLNRDAFRQAVPVHAWTHTVLRRAARLHAATGGLFDIAAASALVRGGWLPRTYPLPTVDGTAADLTLGPGRHVRFRRPLLIDLGGIAKGYAVDRAIAALRRNGAIGGVVNAGGDLRVFGPQAECVHFRRPESPGTLVPVLTLHNAAVATSSHYFAERRIRGVWRAPVHHPFQRRFVAASGSVSVRAAECWLADALCKVVWLAGSRALPLLRRAGARAWILDARLGQGQLTDDSHAA